MPELPEVEVLVRHLAAVLPGRRVAAVHVRREKSIRPDSPAALRRALAGATFTGVRRRGKYLVFEWRPAAGHGVRTLVGHLGMTGRMYLQTASAPLAKHAAVILDLEANRKERLVFEDTRYFGRLTLDHGALAALGPEPLEDGFTPEYLLEELRGSRQAIKVKLLDQSLVAGVGNIYASEALHRAGISPRRRGGGLRADEVTRLHGAIREVLAEAIRFGSTVPLSFEGQGRGDGLFYYGVAASAAGYEERLRVYDRAGRPCDVCSTPVRRLVQGGRSTYYCPQCQR